MPNLSDSRVPRIIAYAEACRKESKEGNIEPFLPRDLRDLSDINLSGADLRGIVLQEVNLSGADLTDANFAGAQLGWVNFSNATLVRANFSGAVLTEAILTGADLTGVILGNSKLIKPVLAGANIILLTKPELNRKKQHLLLQFDKDNKLQVKQVYLSYGSEQ